MTAQASPAELRIVGNARRLHLGAFGAAIALNMAAPREGRHWSACCCWCLDRIDPDAPAHRLAMVREADFPGFCVHCPVNGADVLVAALPLEALRPAAG